MKDVELFDALDGLFAYDGGATDSGIKDELLRERVKKELQERETISKDLLRFCYGHYTPDKGYGLEDIVEFIKWLENEMNFYF